MFTKVQTSFGGPPVQGKATRSHPFWERRDLRNPRWEEICVLRPVGRPASRALSSPNQKMATETAHFQSGLANRSPNFLFTTKMVGGLELGVPAWQNTKIVIGYMARPGCHLRVQWELMGTCFCFSGIPKMGGCCSSLMFL